MSEQRQLTRKVAGLVAAATALTLMAVATPAAEAQVAAPLNSPARFVDPDRVVIADQAAPSGWLALAPDGAGQDGYFVGQTNRSVAIDAYGYAPGFTPTGITEDDMMTLGEYGELGITGDVLDIAVGTTVNDNSPGVAILHTDGAAARLTIRGRLDQGMQAVTSFEVAADADDAIGVIIVDRKIVVATRNDARFYDASGTEDTFERLQFGGDQVIGIARDDGRLPDADSTFGIIRQPVNGCAHLLIRNTSPRLQQGPISNANLDPLLGCTPGLLERAELTFARIPAVNPGPFDPPESLAYVAAVTANPPAAAGNVPRSIVFADSGIAQAAVTPALPTCVDHSVARAAVIHGRSPGSNTDDRVFLRAFCVGQPDAAGNATLTLLAPGNATHTPDASATTTISTRLDGDGEMEPRDILIGFPCNEVDRRQNRTDCASFPTAISALVVSDPTDRSASESTIISHTFRATPFRSYTPSVDLWGERVPLGLELASVDLDDLRLVVQLAPEFDGCRAGTSEPCAPDVRESQPIPVALLAAPPTVAGGGQGGYAPVFGQSTTAGTTATTTESSTFAVTVDGAPSLFDVIEVGVVGTYRQQVDATSTTSLTTTATNGFGGSMDADVVVYSTVTNYVYTGTIVESSTGVSIGDETEILHPAGSVTTTGSWERLQEQFPDEFSPDRGGALGPGTMFASVDAAFVNDVGDPATYLPTQAGRTDDEEVNSFCIGDLNGTPPIRPGGVTIDLNPFVTEQAELFPANQEAILTSDWSVVGAGSNAVETASFDIQAGNSYSYLQSRGLEVETVGRIIGAGISYTGSHTWGAGQGSTLSVGSQFIGGVGQLPSSSLADESYFWRMVLCKRDVVGAGSPWVLTYQVRGYNGDGVDPLAAPDAQHPIDSTTVAAGQRLQFLGSELDVSYRIEVEAVSAADTRRFTVTPTPVAAGSSQVVDIPGGPLLPGELYRWTVTATDDLGRTATGTSGFFRMEGPPEPVAAIDGSADIAVVTVGDTVTLSDVGGDGGSPITLRVFYVNGIQVGTGPSVDWTPQLVGDYLVEVRAWNTFGRVSSSIDLFVEPLGGSSPDPLGGVPAAVDDAYGAVAGTTLSVDAADGVFANDTATTGFTVTSHSEPADASVSVAADGSFVFDSDTVGETSFVYSASDGTRTTTGTVTVDVQAALSFSEDPPSVDPVNASPGASGASVTYEAPVVPGATVECVPASGAFFPIGDTEVTCTASVDAGASAAVLDTNLVSSALLDGVGVVPQDVEMVFTVTVVDVEPPTFDAVGADIVVDDTLGPVAVDFDLPAAGDNDTRPLAVVCDPSPGSVFPVGRTTVRCTATDASGLTATTTLSVTVVTTDLGGLQLPSTGSTTNHLAMVAAGVALVGFVLVFLARRRRSLRVA